jgi:uncharacterized membrane protein YphA (DoxX/SURF4 family)
MKIFVKIVQVIVGLLFIVSGLVKANDPVGLAYKMQEFFELWSEGFSAGSLVAGTLASLHKASLALSIFMITLEIIAGVALLLGWKKKPVLWLLLLLIVFFTFLTGYAYLSGKFTNCGCFGDCLPITPLASFLKDIILLLLIVILLAGQRHIEPVLTPPARAVALAASLFLSLGIQWYVLNYLPVADCLPFKQGNHIPTQMKPPPGAIPDSFAIRFLYEKGGKQYEFAPENLPADFTTYTFVDRKQSLVRKGNAEAPIKGFSLTGTEKDSITGTTVDSTAVILSQPAALMLFALDFNDASWMEEARTVFEKAKSKGIPVYVNSPNRAEAQQVFEGAGISGLQYFNTDFTVVRTVARTNPTVLFLKNGTVEQKWGKQDWKQMAAYLNNIK